MMQDIAATLLMEFEKWVFRAESSGTILKTPLDSQASLSSEEVLYLGVIGLFGFSLLLSLNDRNTATVATLHLLRTFLSCNFQVIKAKKKRLGRAQKTIGDYCLLAGSPVDANAHYSTAIELARLTGDVFWHAGALEGSVCALLVATIPVFQLQLVVASFFFLVKT